MQTKSARNGRKRSDRINPSLALIQNPTTHHQGLSLFYFAYRRALPPVLGLMHISIRIASA
jgi:hypothetical protein